MSQPTEFSQIDIEKIELSDPELREIENMQSDIEEDPNNSFDESKKTIFLNAITKISQLPSMSHHHFHEEESPEKFYEQKIDEKVEQIVKRENEYHKFQLCLGNAIDNEILKYIPKLEALLVKNPGNAGLRELFTTKKTNLIGLKKRMNEMEQTGKLTPEKYGNALKLVLKSNEEIMKRVVGQSGDKEDLTRVAERVDIIKKEIELVDLNVRPKTRSTPPVKIEEHKPENGLIIKSEALRIKTVEQETIKEGKVKLEPSKIEQEIPSATRTLPHKTIPSLHPEQKKDNRHTSTSPIINDQSEVREKPGISVDPILEYLNYKIEVRKSFKTYLEKNFLEKRENDILKFSEEIKKLKTMLDAAEKQPGKITREKVDSVFPELTQKDILGESRNAIEKKVREITQEIASESKEIKNSKIAQSFTSHYQKFFPQLNSVLESENTPMPLVVKKEVLVECNDINPNIKKGDVAVQLKKVKQVGQVNTFLVEMSFVYCGQRFETNFGYNNKTGDFNKEKVFTVDKDKILKKFSSSSLEFVVKKKHVFNDSLVGKASVSLDPLKNFFNLPYKFEMEWDGKSLIFEGMVLISKALDVSKKALKLYVIERVFPAFIAPSLKVLEKCVKSQPRGSVDQGKPVSPGLASVNNKTSKARISVGENVSVPKLQPQEKTVKSNTKNAAFVSKYKYPYLSVKKRKLLRGLLAKNNLNQNFADFELLSFCMSFLQEFEEELEKQAQDFAENDDFESNKEASNTMMQAIKYKKFLENSVGSGKITQEDYKMKIQAFLKVDEDFLSAFEKVGHAQAVYFVKNRKLAIEAEIREL